MFQNTYETYKLSLFSKYASVLTYSTCILKYWLKKLLCIVISSGPYFFARLQLELLAAQDFLG